ncbi:EF-hand domain-containing protein [Tamlana sp. I1]|uniref:EF-hand domain-containing protein n=1 Tax=Tamlana sp. I1 TaxID=2762061 RepID=UPI00188EF82C|nr:EF-hand domain-containing protein [Tamlana sp. I1]
MRITTLKLGTLALALFAFTSVEAQEKKKPDPEKMFKRFDTNNDGAVTLEEFTSAKRKNEVPADKLEKNFKRMDADSDGSVTFEEFKAAQEKGKGKKKKQD